MMFRTFNPCYHILMQFEVNMKSVSRWALPFALIALLLPGLSAQDKKAGQDQAPDSENPVLETGTNESPFKRGEGLFALQLGTSLPLFFWNPTTTLPEKTNLYPGGYLSLRYMGFVATGIALGGEIGAAYDISIARRNFFQVPISFEAAWIGAKIPFEFPVGLGLGIAVNKLGDYLHIDPFLKPQAGVFYRATPAWSFGLMASYYWMPQLHTSAHADQTRFGNFLSVNLSVFNHI
jgi:hypothetical protein